MASAASLQGQAFDSGQFMSSNNMFATPTMMSQISAGANIAGGLVSGIGNLIGQNSQLKAQAQNYRAQATALAKTRDRYIYTFNRDTEQLDANQIMGYISSGLSIDSGTPQAVRQATGNQRSMERNWQVENYNTQVKSLMAAAAATEKQRHIGNAFGIASIGLNLVSGGAGASAAGLF